MVSQELMKQLQVIERQNCGDRNLADQERNILEHKTCRVVRVLSKREKT